MEQPLIGKEIKKISTEAKQGFDYIVKHLSALEALAKDEPALLMTKVHFCLTLAMKPVVEGAPWVAITELEKHACQLAKIYHAASRGVATVEINTKDMIIHAERPKRIMEGTVKVAYLLGRVNGLLGACWEVMVLPEATRGLLSSYFIKAMLGMTQASNEAWRAINDDSVAVDTGVSSFLEHLKVESITHF